MPAEVKTQDVGSALRLTLMIQKLWVWKSFRKKQDLSCAGLGSQLQDIDLLTCTSDGVDQSAATADTDQVSSSGDITLQHSSDAVPPVSSQTASSTGPATNSVPPTLQHESSASEGSVPGITAASAIVCDISNSDLVYPFKGALGLYVGSEDMVTPPSQYLAKWKDRVENRLWTDMHEYQKKMKRPKKGRESIPGLSLELRMSGYIENGSRMVRLFPRIWILYDQEKWKKSLQKFVKELDWLDGEGFGPVEIRKGCPKLATMEPSTLIDGPILDLSQAFRLTDEFALHLHVEQSQGPSACGLICCASITKNGILETQRFSRLGGVMRVGGELWALTAAHSLLELLWTVDYRDLDVSTGAGSDTESTYSSSSSDADSVISSCPTPEERALETDIQQDPWHNPLGRIDSRRILGWESIPKVGPTGFLEHHATDLASIIMNMFGPFPNQIESHADQVADGSSSLHISDQEATGHFAMPYQSTKGDISADNATTSPASILDIDYSLWKLSNIHMLCNRYDTNNTSRYITEIESSLYHEYQQRSVKVLLGPDYIADGNCVSRRTYFSINGVRFEAYKIRTPAPLAQGCSGSWVVDGNNLCGMIVACYENEPYALMMSSSDLLRGIRTLNPWITNIELLGEKESELARLTHASGIAKEAVSAAAANGNQPSNSDDVRNLLDAYLRDHKLPKEFFASLTNHEELLTMYPRASEAQIPKTKPNSIANMSESNIKTALVKKHPSGVESKLASISDDPKASRRNVPISKYPAYPSTHLITYSDTQPMKVRPLSLPTRFPCWCRALYSWGGETEKDLRFLEGDLIECLNPGDGSWWCGRLHKGRRAMGLFPSNFVEVLDDFQPLTHSTSPDIQRAPGPSSQKSDFNILKPDDASATMLSKEKGQFAESGSAGAFVTLDTTRLWESQASRPETLMYNPRYVDKIEQLQNLERNTLMSSPNDSQRLRRSTSFPGSLSSMGSTPTKFSSTNTTSTSSTRQSLISGSTGKFSATSTTSAGSLARWKGPWSMRPPGAFNLPKSDSSRPRILSADMSRFDSSRKFVVPSFPAGSPDQIDIVEDRGKTLLGTRKNHPLKEMSSNTKIGGASASSHDPDELGASMKHVLDSLNELEDSSMDLMTIGRDVNRSDSINEAERQRRTNEFQKTEVLVLKPIDLLEETAQGGEDIEGMPVAKPINFEAINLQQIDANVRRIGSLLRNNDTATSLAQSYICRPYRNDVQRLRAIFTWIRKEIRQSVCKNEVDMSVDTRGLIQRRRGCSREVAVLVSEMCHAVGLRVEVVQGFLKPLHDVTDRFDLCANHWWNNVLVDGEWRVMDCCLAVDEEAPNMEQNLGSRYYSPSDAIADFFFLTRPLEACYTHVASDPAQQRIVPPIDPSTLLALPCAIGPYFRNGLHLQDYLAPLLFLEDLEVRQINLVVPADIEIYAEVLISDAEGDLLATVNGLLAQVEWRDDKKHYIVKFVLPEHCSQAALQIYAGQRGRIQTVDSNPHDLAVSIPIRHTGKSLGLISSGAILRHALSVTIFIFPSHNAHPSSLDKSWFNNNLLPPPSESETEKPSADSVVSEIGTRHSEDPTRAFSTDAEQQQAYNLAKLAIQSPGGKILRLRRKVGDDLQHKETICEAIIKVGERGIWRGLVFADRGATWCVFAEWECV